MQNYQGQTTSAQCAGIASTAASTLTVFGHKGGVGITGLKTGLKWEYQREMIRGIVTLVLVTFRRISTV